MTPVTGPICFRPFIGAPNNTPQKKKTPPETFHQAAGNSASLLKTKAYTQDLNLQSLAAAYATIQEKNCATVKAPSTLRMSSTSARGWMIISSMTILEMLSERHIALQRQDGSSILQDIFQGELESWLLCQTQDVAKNRSGFSFYASRKNRLPSRKFTTTFVSWSSWTHPLLRNNDG